MKYRTVYQTQNYFVHKLMNARVCIVFVLYSTLLACTLPSFTTVVLYL